MRSFRIGRLLDIPVELDLTFLLVLPLFAYLIGSSLARYGRLLNSVLGPTAAVDVGALSATPAVAFGVGTVAAVGLFAGVVLHELGHSAVAMRYGVPISSITLWLFGGVAQLSEMPEDPRQELAIAVAGPVVSVALGVGSYLVFTAIPPGDTAIVAAARFLLAYLAVMNVALAAFNMLPGFPMDGGRVLRALLARTRPYAEATRIAAEVGKLFAIGLGLFGLFGGGGLFLVAMAFFIYIGASSEAQRTTMTAAFEGVSVEDIMTPAEQVDSVSPDTSVATLLDRMFAERHTGYPVLDGDRVVGVVTLGDAQSVREVERDAYTVAEVMSTELETTAPDAAAMDALEQMQEAGVGRLLVMDGDEFVGLISRTDLTTALNIIKQGGAVGRERADDETNLPRIERPS
ncbi:site-2 protease family protein [Halosegnis sp.]|uniref:site-2 protease family protein n=1 Tax=Halosegnis sp. TaxID=2864959 RepID=UPI0035D40503